MSKLLFFFLLFSTLFNIKYTYFPYHSLMTFGVLGFLLSVKDNILNRNLNVKIRSFEIFLLCFILVFCSIISSLANSVVDFSFIKEIVIVNVVRFYAAYFVVKMFLCSYDEKATLKQFIFLIEILVLFQILVALFMFFDRNIYNVLSPFLAMEGIALSQTINALGIRPFGIGSYAFFGAGIINCISLVLFSYLLTNYRRCNRNYIVLILMYLLICVTGILMARTTLVGVVLSLTIILLHKSRLNFIKCISIVVAVCVSLFVALGFSASFFDQMDDLLSFGYEMFFNYMESGQLETSSTNKMLEMYIFPDNIQTWLLGDARYHAEDGGYYMSTDIGYLRMIYYGGVVVLFVFVLYQLKLMFFASAVFKDVSRVYLLVFVALFLILNFKGMTDLSFVLFLFYHLNTYMNGKKSNQCNHSGI